MILSRSHRKRIKRARRKMVRIAGHRTLLAERIGRRAFRAQLEFAGAWNSAARYDGAIAMISGVTLRPFEITGVTGDEL